MYVPKNTKAIGKNIMDKISRYYAEWCIRKIY